MWICIWHFSGCGRLWHLTKIGLFRLLTRQSQGYWITYWKHQWVACITLPHSGSPGTPNCGQTLVYTRSLICSVREAHILFGIASTVQPVYKLSSLLLSWYCRTEVYRVQVLRAVSFALEIGFQLSLLLLYLTNIGHYSLITFVCTELSDQARTWGGSEHGVLGR